MTEPRNVHQRKLAVMKKCDAITAEGSMTIQQREIKYVSIQSLSNRLREFCAEEGLDVLCSVSDGQVVIELVNADEPSDRIVSNWPVVGQDKGWAYSIKYPLMRLFLVGDGDEDEQTMADRSAEAATRAAQRLPDLNHRGFTPPAEPVDEIPQDIRELNERMPERQRFSDALLRGKLGRRPDGLEKTRAELIALSPKVAEEVKSALDVPPAGEPALPLESPA